MAGIVELRRTPGGGRSSLKERAIRALLAERTITAAGKAAGVPERTIRRWLAEDAEFREDYRKERIASVQHATARLQRIASDAADALRKILLSKKSSDAAKVAAARAVFEFAGRGAQQEDLEAKIEELKDRIQEFEGILAISHDAREGHRGR